MSFDLFILCAVPSCAASYALVQLGRLWRDRNEREQDGLNYSLNAAKGQI